MDWWLFVSSGRPKKKKIKKLRYLSINYFNKSRLEVKKHRLTNEKNNRYKGTNLRTFFCEKKSAPPISPLSNNFCPNGAVRNLIFYRSLLLFFVTKKLTLRFDMDKTKTRLRIKNSRFELSRDSLKLCFKTKQ